MSVALVAAEFAGVQLDAKQQEQLGRFRDWLLDEAIKAGGLGPNEGQRIWDRHIADSLVFGVGFQAAARCVDLGTGVGLPGIPLAIAFPDTRFTLVERAGRRVALLRRACAILRMTNCRVVHEDVSAVVGSFPRIVARASLPPDAIMIHVKRLLAPGGVAHVGLTRGDTSPHLPSPLPGLSISIIQIPVEILDTAASLLRIEAT